MDLNIDMRGWIRSEGLPDGVEAKELLMDSKQYIPDGFELRHTRVDSN